MRAEAIQAGDLVYIAHCCHDVTGCVGEVYKVTALAKTITNCGTCKSPYSGLHAWFEESPKSYGYPAEWLRRIPPLDELERTQIVEEASA